MAMTREHVSDIIENLEKEMGQNLQYQEPPEDQQVTTMPPTETTLAVEVKTYFYDEWDFRAGDYKPRWCAVRERHIEEGTEEYYEKTMRDYASLVDQVFGAYGIPFSLERRVPLGNTPLGRGLLALLRCAVPARHGSADDLLTYLRTPGRLDVTGFADKLEAAARKEGARTASRAREIWDGQHPDLPLSELDVLAGAADDPGRLLDQLAKRVEWLFGRPYLRRAHVFALGLKT